MRGYGDLTPVSMVCRRPAPGPDPAATSTVSRTNGNVRERAVDRCHAGCPHPRGGRAHLRARRVGAPRRVGRRGHQDRARRAGRRDARAWRRAARCRSAAACTCCSSTPTGARRASASTSPPEEGLEILYELAADERRVPHQQAAERAHEAAHRRRRHPGPQPERSSTCAAPARASTAPTPTRAPTTRSRTGAGPASRMGMQAARRRTTCRTRRRPRSATRSARMTIAGGIMGALFHRERTGEAHHGRRVAARRRHLVDGRGDGAVAPAPGAVGPAAARRGHRQPAGLAPTRPRTAGSCRSPACRRPSTGPRPAR